MEKYDVVVVGSGNAALCAALSARDNGAKKVLTIEKASKKEAGGNSRYTNGSYRFAYNNFSDLKKIIPKLKQSKKIDYGKEGYIDFTSRRDIEPTIFSTYGNKIFLILILLYIFLIFSFNRIKNE